MKRNEVTELMGYWAVATGAIVFALAATPAAFASSGTLVLTSSTTLTEDVDPPPSPLPAKSAGTPLTSWATLKAPSAAAREPAAAAATASERSSALNAASKDCTHSGER